MSMYSRIRRAHRRLRGVVGRAEVTGFEGSGASVAGRVGGRLVAVGLGVGLVLALMAGAAQAHYVQVGSFGSGQLGAPIGVAVDQSTHDIYAADLQYIGNFKYDSSGNELSPPSPFGQGNFSGAAVDPKNGDVYVLDAGGQAIDTFDPNTGNQVGSPFPITPSANLFGYYTAVQIASDAAGDVYVPNIPNNDVEEYSPTGTLLNTFTGSGATALNGPTGVAVDASGNVWVADDGNGRIEEFDPTGATVLSTITAPGVQDVALDASGDVFASVLDSSGAHVLEFGATGTQIDDFGLGTIGASPYGAVESVAVDDASGDVYVADSANNVVWVFSPPAPPIISGESFSNVGTTYATLSAHVNPLGLDTTYHFQYGTAGPCSSNPCTSYPTPDADAGAGSSTQPVSQNVPGLQPATTYYFRIVATNSKGTTNGPDQSFTTYQTMPAQTCPNNAERTGPSGNLPDCRAYESVTPADIPDGSVLNSVYGWPDGRHVFYLAQTPITPGAESGNVQFLLSSRTSEGWNTTAVVPPIDGPGTPPSTATNNVSPISFTSDFSAAFLNNPFDDDPLDQDNGGYDVYRFDLATGGVSLESRPDSGPMTAAMLGTAQTSVTPPGAWMAGASADGSEVFFQVNGNVPVAPGTTADTHTTNDELYERTGGHTYLVGILPGGSVPACGARIAGGLTDSFGNNNGFTYGAVAPDGSNVLFSASPDCSTSGLYLRNLVNGTTVQLPGTGWAGRTADGTKIFTNDPTNGDLAEYDIASGQLTDIGAGQLLAASDDGSRVYYLRSDNAVYVWDQATPNTSTMIPGTSAGGYASGSGVGGPGGIYGAADGGKNWPSTTPDGSTFLFVDSARLTAYDNQGNQEAYLYRAATNSVICVSCNPSGEPPQGSAELIDWRHTQFNPLVPQTARFLSTDGSRAVFETTDALLPEDHNVSSTATNQDSAGMDVYEWEADGTGSCQSSSDSGGCLYLLSAGTAGITSFLAGASADLHDVYILSPDAYLPGMNGAMHVYDARINGGIPPAAGPAPCSGDACQGAAPPTPPPPTIATVGFSGPGNASPGGRIRVIHRAARGTRFILIVRVPVAGRVSISGSGVLTSHRSLSRPGRYKFGVTLTRRAERRARRRGKLKVRVRVAFDSLGGAVQVARVQITIGPALRPGAKHGRRTIITANRGGLR